MSQRRPFTPADQLALFEVAPLQQHPQRDADEADDLPKMARRLVEMIGLDATISLIQAEGGNELRLAEVIDGHSSAWVRLVEIIGDDAATRLVRDWPDTRIYVPMCLQALRTQRTREIIRRFDAGESFDSIRSRYKISRRHLFRLLKRPG